jgi:hypothetical protein
LSRLFGYMILFVLEPSSEDIVALSCNGPLMSGSYDRENELFGSLVRRYEHQAAKTLDW